MDFPQILTQAPNGKTLSAPKFLRTISFKLSSKSLSIPSSQSLHKLKSKNPRKTLDFTFAADSKPTTSRQSPPFSVQDEESVSVGDDGVPLEGVIQFEKPSANSSLLSSAILAFLVGGDVLCLLVFSAFGRFSHGLPVLDVETLKTADPFVAGWLLCAYFNGGYGDDGKGLNGYATAMVSAARSWVVGIPLGIAIRAATSSHLPQTTFILVAMGSTGILLLGWRALACRFLSVQNYKNDVYRRGNPFELFELLTSLVRRW